MTNSKIGRGKTQLFAVEKHGVEDDVLKLYKKKVPATKISEILKSKGIKIAPLGINRWLSNQRVADVRDTKIQSYKKFETMVINYKDEITDILTEVKNLKEVAYEQAIKGNWTGYDKLVGRLYQGIELLAKLMGDIRPSGSVDINIIINEINKKMFDENKGLRHTLYNAGPIVDVEAEIKEQDKEHKEELQGEKT